VNITLKNINHVVIVMLTKCNTCKVFSVR